MVNHLADAAPNEGCGLIAFDGGRPIEIYPGTNILDSATRYRMAETEVLRAVDDMDRRGWWLGAIYRSHPHSPAEPSTTDLREANWPDALMVIVSFMSGEPEARAWHIEHLSFEPVEIQIVPERLGSRWREQVIRRALALVAPAGNPSEPGVPADWPTMSVERSRTAAGRHCRRGRTLSRTRHAPAFASGRPASVDRHPWRHGPAGDRRPVSKDSLATPATSDQTHIPVVIWADPPVPDRTEALLSGGEDSPAPG